MDEADNLVILALKDIGCPLDDQIKSLKDFDADTVYIACLTYIRLIDETKAENFSDLLPRGMSARVNACSSLAAVIKETGYRTELSYHQLLYPNDNDIRKLLMYLAQAVPKKEITREEAPAALSDLITKSLVASNKDVWLPARRRPPVGLATVPLKTPARGRAVKTVPGLEKYYTKYLPIVTSQPLSRADVVPSIFEANLAAFAEAQERDNEWNSKGLGSGLNPLEYKKKKLQTISAQMKSYLNAVAGESVAKAAVNPWESFAPSQQGGGQFTRKKQFTNEEEQGIPQPKESEEEKIKKQEAEVEALQATLSKLEEEIARMTQESQSFIGLVRQLEARLLEEDARRQSLEKIYRIKKPTLDMLPEAEKNIAQLQSMSTAAAQKLLELAVEWEKHRVPLIEQYRKLKDGQLHKQDETKVKLEKIKEMRGKMKALVEEIHNKEDHYKQLLEVYTALPKDLTRAVYTRRILEIVKNVKKQKIDIDKILIDTRNLKKEINTVSDTLGRIFAVVDELIFQDANVKKDPTAVQGYKHVAAMDEKFKNLCKVIEETGATRNNVLNLEAKIEQIQLRTNSLNMERVEKDLEEIKGENQKLTAQLQKARA